jgi:hypothetical protein
VRRKAIIVVGGLGAISTAAAWRYRATLLEAVDRLATDIEPEGDVDLPALMSSGYAATPGAVRPSAASATFEDTGMGNREGAGSLVGAGTIRTRA